jgi:trigger factor
VEKRREELTVALLEGCKHELEITIPVADVEQETEKVVADIQKKVRLPGFRPGKAPANIVKSKFAGEIRQDVLDNLVPRFFREAVDKENLQVVGQPSVVDLHFHSGEPVRFKAQFEVAPSIELGEYRGVEVTYTEPEVTDQDANERIEQLREQKAEYVNQDPRPLEDGDFAVTELETIAGAEKPMKQDEIMLHIGDPDTMSAFTENLRGASPGDTREFDVTYPEDFNREDLAGKTVKFRATVKGIRKKELPELNDEFAQDLGDYQTFDELKDAVRKAIFREREYEAQSAAKQAIVDKLVDAHEFPVPEAFIDRQVEMNLEQQLRAVASQGIDPRKLKLDWQKIRDANKDKASRQVKSALLLERIAEREAVGATRDEVDAEVQRVARQRREAVAAVRAALEKDGTLRRIVDHIRTEKTLNLLFEQARKVAG